MRLRFKSILIAFMLMQVAHVAYEHLWLVRVRDQVNAQSEHVNSIRFYLKHVGQEAREVCTR